MLTAFLGDACSEAALAWETAFVELASTRLTSMAAAANLTLSFSTERSVEDELQRESTADISTVLLSYLVRPGLSSC